MKKSITEKLVDIDLKRLKDNEEELKNLTNNMPKTNNKCCKKCRTTRTTRISTNTGKRYKLILCNNSACKCHMELIKSKENWICKPFLKQKSRELEEELKNVVFLNENDDEVVLKDEAIKIIRKNLR